MATDPEFGLNLDEPMPEEPKRSDMSVRTICHSVLLASEARHVSPASWTSPAWTALMLRALPVEAARKMAEEIRANCEAILVQEARLPSASPAEVAAAVATASDVPEPPRPVPSQASAAPAASSTGDPSRSEP